MRIKSLTADNFKSLVNFKMELAKLTCLIGLNGAGKSTVLQFIDFVGQLMRGNMVAWLEERKWKSGELLSKLNNFRTIDFTISFVSEDDQPWGEWKGTYNPAKALCTSETITTPNATVIVDNGHYSIILASPENESVEPVPKTKIEFQYQGSILSQLLDKKLSKDLALLKEYCLKITALDLLSPELLRQRTREAKGTMGLGGQNFSAFVRELPTEQRIAWGNSIKTAYPKLSRIALKSIRSGWKQLEIIEQYKNIQVRTEARHVNDGMLRLMAMLAELQSPHQFLLFDEIENGINPELIEFVLQQLQSTNKQVLITTHSPMILNYLDDNTAKSGVMYLYKTAEGETKSIPFFSIPSLAEKLKVMGPGEAFADTMLVDLAKEIATMPQGEK